MIKRFEQYIKEALDIKDFKFSDNFQSIFDAWEDYITIKNDQYGIDFKFNLPKHIDNLDSFCDDIKQFNSDLKVVLSSLEVDGVTYSSNLVINNLGFNIRIFLFGNLIFSSIIAQLHGKYDYYFYTKNKLEDKYEPLANLNQAKNYTDMRFFDGLGKKISIQKQNEIKNIIQVAIADQYEIIDTEYIDDEYCIQIKKI